MGVWWGESVLHPPPDCRANWVSPMESVQLQDGPQLKLAEASLFIAGDTFRLAPAALVGEEGQGAQLEGDYNVTTRALNATISGQGLRLLSRAAVPLVNRFQGGKWSAALQVPPGRRRARCLERQLRCSRHQHASTRRRRSRAHIDSADRYRRRRVEGSSDASDHRPARDLWKLCVRPGRCPAASIRFDGSEGRDGGRGRPARACVAPG